MITAYDRDLRDVLEPLFDEPVELIDARPSALQSSCALTEISLRAPAGARHRLLLKDLGARSPGLGPGFLYDRLREPEAYRLLGDQGLKLARLVGAEIDQRRGRSWMFIEWVEGVPLWQSGDAADWCRAAEWLADLHALAPPPRGRPWLSYDARYYARWLDRALAFAPAAGLGSLVRAYAAASEQLTRSEEVIVHGDYYPANVIVRAAGGPGVCPVDLELVGIGAGELDLAALITGLPAPLAVAVVEAYRTRRGRDVPGDQLLASARLALAVRWLGWMPRWEAPEHQRFDWAAEARAAAAAVEGWS